MIDLRHGGHPATTVLPTPELRQVATGIAGGEGPVYLPDGSLLVCEMATCRITRIRADGRTERVVELEGTPNGAALGPDGCLYVCNRGRTVWREQGELIFPDHRALELRGGGSIQRVTLATGQVETLYTHCSELELNAPNDLVFDAQGGFYFTDFGHLRSRDRDVGSVYYALPDGSSIRRVISHLDSPNGIGISPDGQSVCVAETFSRHFLRFGITAPGEIARSVHSPLPHGGDIIASPGGLGMFDSFAFDSAGYALVAGVLAGVLYVISPAGQIETIPMPDMAPTNVCFGGEDLATAYITLATTQRVVAMRWPRAGLRLAF